MKLNQVLAIEKGTKSKTTKKITQMHRAAQRPELYEGRVRTYTPVDEEGEQLPSEKQHVQLRADKVLEELQGTIREALDIEYTKNMANQRAAADVIVDDKVLLEKVPVTHLLYLEKQLTDIHTFITKMPTLSTTEEWKVDEAQGIFATPPQESVRTKKVPKSFVAYEATEHHPAQVQVFNEDKVVGKYRQVLYSGALTVDQKETLLKRLDKLMASVKMAREEANTMEVTRLEHADKLFSYILGD